MITGTPKIDVSALIGKSLPSAGRELMKRHNDVHKAPRRAVYGMSERWLSVRVIIRAI